MYKVVFELSSNILTLGVKDTPAVIDAEPLWGRVRADDCYWEIDEVWGQPVVLSQHAFALGQFPGVKTRRQNAVPIDAG